MDDKGKKLLKFLKGSTKELKNDDFVVRFVASPTYLIKIVYVFIYATYEYITEALYLDSKDEKEINKFFQEQLEEWGKRTPIDKILKEKYHYLIYGNISRRQAKKYIEEEYPVSQAKFE